MIRLRRASEGWQPKGSNTVRSKDADWSKMPLSLCCKLAIFARQMLVVVISSRTWRISNTARNAQAFRFNIKHPFSACSLVPEFGVLLAEMSGCSNELRRGDILCKEELQMMEINFNAGTDPDAHQCESYREGDWIIFRCPQCEEYERRINWRTGEMSVANSESGINHQGFTTPGATIRTRIFRPSFLN